MRVSGAFSYTNNEIVVLRHKIGDTVVKNPIADENRQKIIRLIIRCAKLAPHASEKSQSKIEDISSNLTLYLDSDDGVWPDYRKTVPFDFILREFLSLIHI